MYIHRSGGLLADTAQNTIKSSLQEQNIHVFDDILLQLPSHFLPTWVETPYPPPHSSSCCLL